MTQINKQDTQAVALVLISVILYLFSSTSLVSSIEGGLFSLSSPANMLLHQAGSTLITGVNLWKNVQGVIAKNRSLTDQVTQLQSKLTHLSEVEQENAVLRQQLDQPLAETTPLLLARVIGVSPAGESWVVIDKGSKSGVKLSDVVIYQNYLVGKVIKLTQTSAKVEVITSSSQTISASDLDSPFDTRGVVTGRFGSSLFFEKILPTEVVNVGDTIVTSGTSGDYPPGLILGAVESVNEDPALTLKEAKVKLLIDLKKLNDVFVVRLPERP